MNTPIEEPLRNLLREIRESGIACQGHLDLAMRKIKQLCRRRGICLVRVTGRVKPLKRCRAKLLQMIRGTPVPRGADVQPWTESASGLS